MGYRISYVQRRRRIHWWLPLILAAGLAALRREEWHEALAKYVGASIRCH